MDLLDENKQAYNRSVNRLSQQIEIGHRHPPAETPELGNILRQR